MFRIERILVPAGLLVFAESDSDVTTLVSQVAGSLTGLGFAIWVTRYLLQKLIPDRDAQFLAISQKHDSTYAATVTKIVDEAAARDREQRAMFVEHTKANQESFERALQRFERFHERQEARADRLEERIGKLNCQQFAADGKPGNPLQPARES